MTEGEERPSSVMPAFEGEEVIMRKPMTSRGEASSSPAMPICPMIWRERAAERMQEGIPVSPGLLNQLRQIAQVCAAPWPPVDKMR